MPGTGGEPKPKFKPKPVFIWFVYMACIYMVGLYGLASLVALSQMRDDLSALRTGPLRGQQAPSL